MDKQSFKSSEEKQWLLHFKEQWEDFPKGKLEKSESPDFILRPGKHYAIGLEMTKIFLQHKEGDDHFVPLFEEEKYEVVNLARELFLKRNRCNINVHLKFSEVFYAFTSDFEGMAVHLAALIQEHLEKRNLNKAFLTSIGKNELPAWMDRIDIVHHPEDKLSSWVVCKVHIPNENFIQSIQFSIDQKEEKLPLYKKQNLDRYWLLIIAECLECAAPFNLHNQLENWIFPSRFNRIFLYEIFERKIYFLK